MAILSLFSKAPAQGRSASPLRSWPPSRLLTIATLFYLALPILIFELGWLRFPFNLLFPLLLLASLFIAGRNCWGNGKQEWADDEQKRFFWRSFWWTYLPLAFCVINSGAGGFGDQSYDWHNKHNIVLADLMRFNWPVRYPDMGDSFGQGPYNLVYYVAYYVPAACVGKIAGWTAANVALQMWTQAGMLLFALWLVTLLGPRSRWIGVLFIVFSGADNWGQYIAYPFNYLAHGTPIDWRFGDNELWWTHLWKWQQDLVKYYVLYYSNFQHLFWAPQHLLASCLGCALLLRPATNTYTNASQTEPTPAPAAPWAGSGFDVLVFSLLPMWSPFAAVGCLPLLLFNAARNRKRKREQRVPSQPQQSRAQEAFFWFCNLSLLALSGCFLAARLHLPDLPKVGTRGVHMEFLPIQMWRDVGWLTIPAYLLFYTIEFALLLFLAWPFLRGKAAVWRGYAAVAGLVLFLLPLFQFGMYNDLVMRGSIPLLLVVCLVVFEALKASPLRQWRWRQAAIVFLLIGGLGHSIFYGRGMFRNTRYQINLAKNRQWSRMLQIHPLSTIPNLYQEYRLDERQQLVAQYIGDDSSIFARVLLKEKADESSSPSS